MSRNRFAFTLVVLLALSTVACTLGGLLTPSSNPSPEPLFTNAPTLTVLPVTETALIATQTSLPSATSVLFTATSLPPTTAPVVGVTPLLPTATRVRPTATLVVARLATATPSVVPGGSMTVKVFLIAINDNGASGKKIGCNDSVVGVNVEVPRSQGVLRAALTQLLSLKSRDYGMSGLVNALYQSDLTIDSLAIQNGEAIIRLKGTLASGGVCDDPRIIAQLEQTALQFTTVSRVTIYVNGTKIQDLLSGRG